MAPPDITQMSDEELARALLAANSGRAAISYPEWIGYAQDFRDAWLWTAHYVRTLIPPAAQPVARVPVGLQMDAIATAEVRPRHDTDVAYAALLSTVIDVGVFLSGIVDDEADASEGAHQPNRPEHLRLLAMCKHALDLARAEGGKP